MHYRPERIQSVSYTHLDVYKRQEYPQLIKQKNTWIQLKPINLTHEKFPSFLGEC